MIDARRHDDPDADRRARAGRARHGDRRRADAARPRSWGRSSAASSSIRCRGAGSSSSTSRSGSSPCIASLRVLPRDEPRPTERFDALGLILLSPGLALVIYGLAQSSSHGGLRRLPRCSSRSWSGSCCWRCSCATGCAPRIRCWTCGCSRTGCSPRRRRRSTVFALAVFGGMLLLPLYLQAVRGESALASGLLHGAAGHRGDDHDAHRREADRPHGRRQDRAAGDAADHRVVRRAHAGHGDHVRTGGSASCCSSWASGWAGR